MFWNQQATDTDRLRRYEGTLNVRTLFDLDRLVLQNLSRVAGAAFVVGIPRSGLLVANIIALHLNIPIVTLQDFLGGNFSQPYTRRHSKQFRDLGQREQGAGDRVIIVDDTIATGGTMNDVRAKVVQLGHDKHFKIQYAAAYASSGARKMVDIYFENLDAPRIFEWNLMHHVHTRLFCIDLDGVLCDDPTTNENDDGPLYEHFCLNAALKVVPSAGVGAVVTARLERYRPQTEAWLQKNGIRYERLVMCNLSSGEERRRLGAHAKMKAHVYKTMGGLLFVESDPKQAQYIRQITGQPVYCYGDGRLV